MTSECISKTREERTIEHYFQLTLHDLTDAYLHSYPEKSRGDFEREVIKPLSSEKSTSGDSYLEEFSQIAEKKKPGSLKFAALLISCAYCIEVARAIRSSQRERAWSYMADARYWAGVTLSNKGLEDAEAATIKATRKGTAQKAGKARADKKFQKIIDEAYRLATERQPKANGWKSRRQATLAIAPDVLKFSVEINQKLSEQQAVQTIYDWLRKMPDAELIFPKKSAR